MNGEYLSQDVLEAGEEPKSCGLDPLMGRASIKIKYKPPPIVLLNNTSNSNRSKRKLKTGATIALGTIKS